MIAAADLGVREVQHLARVGSTMDVAHAQAQQGHPGGLLVLADAQDAGRGRGGNRWTSVAGAGLWLTLLERPAHASAMGVLALRLGLACARVLDAFSDGPVRLKWPNDLYAAAGKIGGILVEARWQERAVDWVAIGLGVNLRVPDEMAADTSPHAPPAALRPGTDRDAVLRALVPAMRDAVHGNAHDTLTAHELSEWAARDAIAGAALRAPVAGTVLGLTRDGHLRVGTPEGERTVHAGTLVFTSPTWWTAHAT